MDDLRKMLLEPTKELIAKLEPIKHQLSKQQLIDLEQLKMHVFEYELEQNKGVKSMSTWNQFCEFDDGNFADELIEKIENDYGQSIKRIPKFERVAQNRFEITIIFPDYRMLEAEIIITDRNGEINIELQGMYL